MRSVLTMLLLSGILPTCAEASASGGLQAWRKAAKVTAVCGDGRHSIHSYYNLSPESPDGRMVLFYASRSADGYHGQVCVRDRGSGDETVLADNVAVEDAHRAACQQWVSRGKRVAFHAPTPDGSWGVFVVNLATNKCRLAATGRQLGFGQPDHDIVPLYGPHWNPGGHRSLELLDVATGTIVQTPLTPEAIVKAYPDFIKRVFDDRTVSVAFPMLSPDRSRVLVKMATPAGGDFRSREASERRGLLCYDLKRNRFLMDVRDWGHPAWHPDSRHLLNHRGRITDVETGKVRTIPLRGTFVGSHPSFSPDGSLFTLDARADMPSFDGPKGSWAIVVGDVQTGEYVTVHRFDNTRGARSWRRSHPHPVFSPDGRRIYFNVSSTRWTQLYVAETHP